MKNRDIKRSMRGYLPRFYDDIREVQAIIDSESSEFEQIRKSAQDVLDQFYIDRVTWMISDWERFIGDKNAGNYDNTTFSSVEQNEATFEAVTNNSWYEFEKLFPLDLEIRRQNIKAKIRGHGTVTKALIKNVAESYTNGKVEVIEDAPNYTVTIKFVGEYGVPADIDKVKEALREIIPAHLAIYYEYKYVTYIQLYSTYANYDALNASGLTYDQILMNGE